MKDMVRDFFAGSLIITAGFLVSLLLLLGLGLLWLFFHILGAVFVAVFYIFLFFAAVWLVGFLFRKARQGDRKQDRPHGGIEVKSPGNR